MSRASVPQLPPSFQGDQGSYDNRNSSDREAEQLATGVSELVLQSPTDKKSKLRPEAAEFVPSWMKPQPALPRLPMSSSTPCGTNVRSAPPARQCMVQESEDVSHYLLSDIRMYVAHLYASPESFDEIAITILDLLVGYAYNDTILAAAVDQIFCAGLEYNDFSFQCARLFTYLLTNYWGYGGPYSSAQGSGSNDTTRSVRDLLLKRCRDEQARRLAGPLPCLYNYGLLLADLYNQLNPTEGNLTVLADAVLSVVSALLEAPNNGNVAGAVSILKCCGASLEKQNAEQLAKLDAVFNKFETLLQADTGGYGLSEEGKTLIRNILKSRADWKKYPAQSQSFQPVSDTVYDEALTAEEVAFLERELGALQSPSSAEEEDDGIDEAYEQFLRMTEEKLRAQN